MCTRIPWGASSLFSQAIPERLQVTDNCTKMSLPARMISAASNMTSFSFKQNLYLHERVLCVSRRFSHSVRESFKNSLMHIFVAFLLALKPPVSGVRVVTKDRFGSCLPKHIRVVLPQRLQDITESVGLKVAVSSGHGRFNHHVANGDEGVPHTGMSVLVGDVKIWGLNGFAPIWRAGSYNGDTL